MKTYEIKYKSKYYPFEGTRKKIVRANNKTEAWDYLKYEILCTDEYKKVSCVEVK